MPWAKAAHERRQARWHALALGAPDTCKWPAVARHELALPNLARRYQANNPDKLTASHIKGTTHRPPWPIARGQHQWARSPLHGGSALPDWRNEVRYTPTLGMDRPT